MATINNYVRWSDNTEELAKHLRQGHDQVVALQSSVDKMVKSLSGDQLLRSANTITAAVSEIGGASKLTENEAARVNATLQKALDKYKALGVEAPAALVELEKATRRVEQQTTLADKAAGFLKSTFAQFTLASLASSAIQSLVSGLMEFARQGAMLPAIQTAFNRLSSALQQDAGDMLQAMRTATQGMVRDLDLMLSANKAMLLGLPVTTESMGELAEAAVTLGRAMGLDAKKSLDDLITALGRSSPMILDNLGLTVKVGEANEAYAEKLGKTASQLTDAEKKMAFYEAALEAARKKTQELGEHTKTLGELATTAWTNIANIVTAGAATANVGLGAVLSSGANFIQFLKDSVQHGAGFATQMAALRAEAESQAKSTQAVADAVEAALSPTEAYRKKLEELAVASASLTAEQAALVIEGDKLGQSTKDIAEALGVSEVAVKAASDAHKELTKTLEAESKAYQELLSWARNEEGLAQQQAMAETMARAAQNATALWEMETEAYRMAQEQKAADLAKEGERVEANERFFESLDTLIGKQVEVGASATEATGQAAAGFAGLTQQVNMSADALRGWIELQKFSAASNAILAENKLWTSATQLQKIAALPIPGRAGGGSVDANRPYMVGERGPELFVPGSSGSIVPNGAGGMSVVVQVDARESMYDTPAGVQKMAEKVSSAVMARLRAVGAA